MMEEKQKLIDITKKIGSIFKNTEIGFVENRDIIDYFKNKENAKLIQKQFFLGPGEKDNVL